jgi:hypothetical protein
VLASKYHTFRLEWVTGLGLTWTVFGSTTIVVEGERLVTGSVSTSRGGVICDLNDGFWHHVAGTYNSTSRQATLVIDGVTMGSATADTITFGMLAMSDRPLYLLSAAAATAYRGLMDEVRVCSTPSSCRWPTGWASSRPPCW